MFESKNNSPARIAFYISASAALTALLIALLAGNKIAKWAVISSVVFLVSFLVARYLINEFIYRRVKLIYKFINQTKASKREEFFQKNILPQQSLDEVGDEVLKWTDHRKAEM